MRKVAIVFVLAVLVPSLVLAWLAVRSVRDQQFLMERQQSLLYQRVTDAFAKDISERLSVEQQNFATLIEALAATNSQLASVEFDDHIRRCWPLAEIGFCVALSSPAFSQIICPVATTGPDARQFLRDNAGFLGNKESAEVYWNANNSYFQNTSPKDISKGKLALNPTRNVNQVTSVDAFSQAQIANSQLRAVDPINQGQQLISNEGNYSKLTPAEAEFRQLIGDNTDGMVARFVQNKLRLFFWHRLSGNPNLIFGAQVAIPALVKSLESIADGAYTALADDRNYCLAIVDDNALPRLAMPAKSAANWKHPFAATEIGEALPHWEAAIYLVNPAAFESAAQKLKSIFCLLVMLLVVAIGIGGWVLVYCMNKELQLARRKTDFVSNVSHELKTPLTSIRMFSELLAEGRVSETGKQKSYLNIITAEAGRLTRLIDNVLDFSRLERGEKKYNFQSCDIADVARGAVHTFRPHLEANGFKFEAMVPEGKVPVQGDCDALAQIIVNLLSNAEKYSNGRKEVMLVVERKETPVPHAEVKVLDRGPGVPRGSEEKIFEKFYRAHNSLSSGIQGSGLGLTIARQIARAHGGDVVFEAREGGGSCFCLRLPRERVSTDKHG